MDINGLDENFLIGDSVYIVGHKRPDLDAIVSAYTYQIYRHSRGDFNYIAIRCDEVNPITKWVFKYFKLDLPMLIRNVEGKKIVLVDHTDPVQRPDGWEKAEIIEVMDHHNLKLETTMPPKITIRPYGSTTTLIGLKLLRGDANIQPEIAGLMLAAILDDTLALRSPITTYVDRSVAGQLGVVAGISDISKFARELFDHKDIWLTMKPQEIIETDIKSYDSPNATIEITQVETMDNQKIANEKGSAIYAELNNRQKKDPKDIRMVLLSDLIRGDSIAIVAGNKVEDLTKIFDSEIEDNHTMYLPGMISRKKDVVPPLLEYYK